MNIGKAIRTCRTQRNLKQSDIANTCDLSVSYLSLLELGKRDPSFTTVEIIANALNVPLSILIFLTCEPSKLEKLSQELIDKLSSTFFKLMSVPPALVGGRRIYVNRME